MRQMLSGVFWVLLVVLAGCGAGGDAAKLQGSWEPVSQTSEGQEKPTPKDAVLVFADDKYIMKQGDRVSNEWTFTVDSSKNPKQLLVNRGEQNGKVRFSYLIYKIEGDTLTTQSGSGTFPASFTPNTDRGCALTVYRRSK